MAPWQSGDRSGLGTDASMEPGSFRIAHGFASDAYLGDGEPASADSARRRKLTDDSPIDQDS